jgi:alcohol dehydrogenase class IV
LLPEVTAWSVDHAPVRYADCARFMGIATGSDSDQLACASLVDALRALTADLQVPGPKAFGIDRGTWFDSLDLMATQALDSGSPANNPRVPDAQDIVRLYEAIW